MKLSIITQKLNSDQI